MYQPRLERGFFCAFGKAHSLGGGSPQLARKKTEASRKADANAAQRGPNRRETSSGEEAGGPQANSSGILQLVCERETLWFACQRVVANKGAAGADGIAAGEFKGHLKQHWLAIMAKLPVGKYNAHERPCNEANQASSNACLRLGQCPCPCPVLAPQSIIANRRITDIV